MTVTVQIVVNEEPVKTVEGQQAFGRVVLGEVERALDENGKGLAGKLEEIIRRAVR